MFSLHNQVRQRASLLYAQLEAQSCSSQPHTGGFRYVHLSPPLIGTLHCKKRLVTTRL
jgi:hypothetical protein